MHKRVMALLLSLVLLVSAIMPTTAMAAEDEGGSFVFVAMNANSTIVEPTRIQYKSGQTIQQALADSDIEFVGLEQGFIYEINGVSANYLLYYDKGGYKLDAPASSIKALCFHVSSTYSDDAIQLILQMADYLDMTNHVQNYPAAANAYAAAEGPADGDCRLGRASAASPERCHFRICGPSGRHPIHRLRSGDSERSRCGGTGHYPDGCLWQRHHRHRQRQGHCRRLQAQRIRRRP